MTPNSPKPGTRLHPVRLEEPLWKAAQAKATAAGTTVSAVVREFLGRWINETSDEQDAS